MANGPDFAIAWDKEKYPKEPWWDKFLVPNGMHHDRDHTLRTAFRQSVVWFFRELALAQGEERMQRYLDRFDYGNRDISSGLDSFWLTGSIAISAEEQVTFLKKLYFGQLGVSETATAIAKDVFAIEKGEGYVLSAKTGTGGSETTPFIGWYVGYVEKGNDVYFFAFNMPGKDFGEILNKRVPLAKGALRALGVLE